MISLVVAMAANNVIGSKNDLPWYLPEDLKRFKKITSGHTVLMGRKTYESIITRLGKPLPNRVNVVVSRQNTFQPLPGVLVFRSLEQALSALKHDDLFIIGGAEIFKQALPVVEKMYITHVAREYPGDVRFPEIKWDEWDKIEDQPHEGFSFATYKKGSGKT